MNDGKRRKRGIFHSLIYQAVRCLPNNGLSAHFMREEVDDE